MIRIHLIAFLMALPLIPSAFSDDSGSSSSLGQSDIAECKFEHDGSEKRVGGELQIESALRRSSDTSSKTSGSAQ
jgi:hypothetical protein